jgi:hypothetical protein
MTKLTYLGRAKPGSPMHKRGWLFNIMPQKPAEKPEEKKPEKKEKEGE